MSFSLTDWIQRFQPGEPVAPEPLSLQALDQISAVGQRHLGYWNETSSALSKWILGTLITLNAGGMLLVFNLGLHPDAVGRAGVRFFIGTVCALIAGILELRRLENGRNFFYAVDVAAAAKQGGPTVRDFDAVLRSGRNRGVAFGAGFLSLAAFFLAGGEVLSGTRFCTADDYSVSSSIGASYVPGPKGAIKYCYYYSVEGLPDDPLKRAQLEQQMIKHLRETHSWPLPTSKSPK